jgi:NADH:ubiquinone reductase (H+-translocating)
MIKILILGGGFGGVYAARELQKLVAKNPDVRVTLIGRENFLLFTPMLHEVATGGVSATANVSPIRQLLRKTDFLQGDVNAIDLAKKTVSVVHCSGTETEVLEYDYLLFALGSETNFFGLPGLKEGALTMKTLEDAIKLRNNLIASLEEAEFDVRSGRQKPLLTYIVAGAGFAGAETVAAINDFLREAVTYYPILTEDMIRVVLVDMIPIPLPELGEELGKYAAKKMSERRIEMRMNTKVTGLSERGLEFADGNFIRAVLVVWTAGVTPSQVLRALPCKLDRGRLVANEFLEVPGYPGVWAIGDCSMVIDPNTGKPYPPTAQHACREGTIAGRNIAAAVRGSGAKVPFRYKTMGLLAAIGRHTGVAEVFGFRFSGFIAWLMWRAVYLMKLPGLDRQLRVAFAWTLDMIFPKDYVQFMTLAKPLVQNEYLEDKESKDVIPSVSSARINKT